MTLHKTSEKEIMSTDDFTATYVREEKINYIILRQKNCLGSFVLTEKRMKELYSLLSQIHEVLSPKQL
jgi:hypothetical protein